ncbi:hypothetical protein [Nostoc sp.]
MGNRPSPQNYLQAKTLAQNFGYFSIVTLLGVKALLHAPKKSWD